VEFIMIRQLTAVVLSAAVATSGCASVGGGAHYQAAGPRYQATTGQATKSRTATLLSEYVSQLPIGSKVRVVLFDGRRLRGTLMKADESAVVLRPRGRIPEAPIEIPFDRIIAVDIERESGNVGKSIAIGVAAGVGGVMAVFAILAAIYSD
jgi:hypothetical protein